MKLMPATITNRTMNSFTATATGRVHPLAVTGAASRAPSAGADPGPTRQARSARLRWSIAVGAVVLLALLLLLLLTGALS